MQCAQYLLFFRPEEEDLPGLNGFEPEELPPPLGFLGAGLSLSEPDEEPECFFSLFLAWWGVGARVKARVRVRVRVRVEGLGERVGWG